MKAISRGALTEHSLDALATQDLLYLDGSDVCRNITRNAAAAGQHLHHVAKIFGEVFHCPGGWLRRQLRHTLPSYLRFLGEVKMH